MNYSHMRKVIGNGLFLAFASVAIASTAWAEPNTGGGGTKTQSDCKADYNKCSKYCDSLIDVGTQVQDCRNKCQDKQLICLRVGSTGDVRDQVGGGIGGGVYQNTRGSSTLPNTAPGFGGKLQSK